MKVVFDVNVVIDLFSQNDCSLEALAAYDVANLRGMDTCLSASCMADIAYILHRRGLDSQAAREAMDAVFAMFTVLDISGADCRRAYGNGMRDFEDALIAECAASNGAALIVTRNIRDFRMSPVPVHAPAEFIERYQPDGYAYDEVVL